MTYTVIVEASVRKSLRRLPEQVRDRLNSRILALADDPRPSGCLKMEGKDNEWRIRVGDYRIIYSIQDMLLLVRVLEAGPRRDIYKRR